MSGWVWECDVKHESIEICIEHDGRVIVTISTHQAEHLVVVDTDDFERMCHSFIERIAHWRQRIAEQNA